MPGIEDWSTQPYETIQRIFDQHSEDSHEVFVRHVEEYFSQRLNETTIKTVQSVNSCPVHQLKSGTLVRYRCMVQDVFDPQFFAARYTVTSTKGEQPRVACGSFRDVPEIEPDESLEFDGPLGVTAERQGFYCVPIPGEANWVEELNSQQSGHNAPSTSSTGSRVKRGRDEEGEDCSKEVGSGQKMLREEELEPTQGENRNNSSNQSAGIGRVNDNTGTNGGSKSLPSLNMPWPDQKGVPCIVRVYSSNVELKTTDAVEIFGVLCTDPRLAGMYDDEESSEPGERAELQAHEPPASLVPRLHAVLVRHLEHNNPILPPTVASDDYKRAVTELLVDAASLRLELLSILQHALLGDRLAAEYLLCQLVSSVHARVDLMPLGKFCVNLSQVPVSAARYTQFLHHLLENLTSQCVNIQLTIDNMNKSTFVPKKDYSTNRLSAGLLQLSAGTRVVVDETVLNQGNLDSNGVKNVRALSDLIQWQRVDYDFQFHPIPVPTNVSVLVLSEGESLLAKDVHLPMTPAQTVSDVSAHFAMLDTRLVGDNLAKLRSYVTVCRLLDYSVADDTQKVIQEEFVSARQSNPNNMTVEDFQTLLGLLRLICLSNGVSSPTLEMWQAARGMEEARKERVARLPGRPVNGGV